ncbi:hypothetical protein D9758_009126 [Tetrapyrgos nigripes]|uniref:Multidrug resistance-associated ABC transporter n=1 Tax=Tetrapyrgos nigripes TaxID=182062 RepID=A0A8H5G8H1_9AGAR|nr:hypothetical protein D9758_009126 [Tetrapyrgos nigripes]
MERSSLKQMHHLWPLTPDRETKALSDNMERAFYERCPPEKRPRHLRNDTETPVSVPEDDGTTDDAGSKMDASDGKTPKEKPAVGSKPTSKSPDSAAQSPYDESLPKAIHQQFLVTWWTAGMLDFAAQILRTTTPQLNKVLLNWLITSYVWFQLSDEQREQAGIGKPRGIGYGIGLAFALFVMQESASLFYTYNQQVAMRIGMSVRAGVIGSIFRKSLRLSGRARAEHSVGEVMTMISTDCTRLDHFAQYGHHLWISPIQIIVALGLLIGNLGYSALVGIGVLILGTPIQGILVMIMFKQRQKAVAITDKRMRLTTEVLQGIRLLKFYGWEDFYISRITGLRQGELNAVRKSAFALAGIVGSMSLIPVLATILSFITYSLTGHDLNVAIIFTSLQFFNIIQTPLIILPMVLSSMTEMIVAVKRISSFLTAEDQPDPYLIDEQAKNAIVVDGDFSWDAVTGLGASTQEEDKEKKEAEEGKGKGSTKKKKDKNMDKGNADSVLPVTTPEEKEIKEEEKPAASIHSSQEEPFKMQNLSLAVPRNAFVAIVGRVGSGKSSILQALIGEMRRTRGQVVFGGSIAYVPQTPWIKNATVRENIVFGNEDNEARFREVIRACSLEHDLELLSQGENTEIGEKGINLSGGQKARVSLARAAYSSSDIVLLDDPLSAVDSYVGKEILENCLLSGPLVNRTRVLVTHALHFLDRTDYIYVVEDGAIKEHGTYRDLTRDSPLFARLMEEYGKKQSVNAKAAQKDDAVVKTQDLIAQKDDPLIQAEERLVGAVSWTTYKKYLRAAGGLSWAPAIFACLVLLQSSQVGNNLTLSYWTATSIRGFSQGDYMGLYVGFGAGQAIFAFLLTLIFVIVGIKASLSLFKAALWHVLRSPVSFFDTTPMGRFNTLSGISLRPGFTDRRGQVFLSTFASVLGTIGLVFYIFPLLGIIFAPLTVLYWIVSVYYRRSSVEVKRLDSLMRSVFYSSYSETLTGLSTIRAYRDQKRSITNAEAGLDLENRAYYMTITFQHWLTARLDLFANTVVLGIALFAAGFRDSVNPARTGVVLSYALNVTQIFGQMISSFAQNEQNFNAVERLVVYSELPSEDQVTLEPVKDLPMSWPSKGAITFKNVDLVYREGLPVVLKDCETWRKSKSSLLQALFRIVEIQKGSIEIDGLDIRSIDLDVLRNRLALVPQDSTMFLGTLRENLDPMATRTDAELISNMKRAWLLPNDGTTDPVAEAKFSLDSNVGDEGWPECKPEILDADTFFTGSNFSAGERQLLALCRALDEATSSVDVETDAKLQQTIQSEFADSTLLCIAHRLNTIAHYDRVLVMDAGKVAELGTVLELFDKEDSIFRSLCNEADLTREDILHHVLSLKNILRACNARGNSDDESMLSTLLTPLRAKFDLSPRTPNLPVPPPAENDDLSPEDFARDVLIELMRNSVSNLTEAETLKTRTEVLSEIHRIMLQDGRTKDVFRELDGLLVLMSALAAMGAPSAPGPIVEPAEQVLADTLECTRLAFMVLAEAISQHSENADYFKVSVGYDSLSSALAPLISDPKTAHETLGLLLSLSLNDFTLSNVFVTLKHADPTELDSKVSGYQTRLSTIVHAEAIHILWRYLPDATPTDSPVYYATLKLFDALTVRSHRNQAVLSTVDFVSALVDRFCEVKGDENKKRRSVVQKLLRRFLDMGATTAEAQRILQSAVRQDGTLDMEIMELIRGAMKSRWLDHFSMESLAMLSLTQDGMKGLPVTGFTFMMWLWIAKFPSEGTSHRIFAVRSGERDMVLLKLRHDGKLMFQTSGNSSPVIFSKLAFAKARWIHLTLVHYPGRDRASNPTIRLFIDGVLNDHVNWSYPKPISTSSSVQYMLGDDAKDTKLSWCIASSYFLSTPLADDLPRLIHHLGPRYFGNFQDPALVKFFTYEASTSLSMFLSTVAAASSGTSATTSMISKVLRDGLGISESSIVFALSPLNIVTSGSMITVPVNGSRAGALKEFSVKGDVYMVKVECLDAALWKIGGISVALRLIQVANTAHEVSRALSVLTDGLKNNWQNSEDMERLRGYEVLADILRTKTSLINMTSFETIFEFLGINFRSPDHSTITNVVAYKCLALDFELWSHTRLEIQRVHFEHFITLLETSRYKKFNTKQRIAKIGLVRRLLFVLQTDWYQGESLTFLMDAFKVAMNALWTKDETIKPIVSFLAANLQEDLSGSSSPKSIMSRIDHLGGREKAEKVFELLVATLSVPSQHTKFCAALPINRIILLLLGDRPSPLVAKQCLVLVRVSVGSTSSFIRKFEMISGWNVLKTVLPSCWDLEVNEAAFDLLLLAQGNDKGGDEVNIVCPQVVPIILSALHSGLNVVARNSSANGHVPTTFTTEATMESLVEKLMNLHARSGAFRHIFQSQQTTQLFVNAYKDFVAKISGQTAFNDYAVRILEKMAHLGLALALDNSVAGAQKRDILSTLQTAEQVLNPAAESTQIDPNLVADTRSVRQRFASARFSLQIGERTVMKIITRIIEWRKTIQVSERKRLRKNILDLRENRRQVSRLYEWTYRLTSERGLWYDNEPVQWRLDETEGPHRIRKKMEPVNPRITIQYVEGQQQPLRGVQIPDSEAASAIVQTEVPPWADSYEIASTEMEDRQLVEEITEDKHRKVRHELEPGDVIEAVQTVARISGVDSSPGLLIIGHTHLYMLDGLVEGEDGEVIDAHEAPKQLFFVPGSIVELDGPQRAQRWSHDQVATCSDKTFIFRDVALEIYFKDSRSLLIVFLDKNKRLDVHHRLTAITSRLAEVPTPGLLRTPLFGRVSAGARALSGLWNDELSTAQRRWQAREISNISGRTPSDATQYPVFRSYKASSDSWVLQDYQSQTLDLTDPKSYRDLTKPMGALTDARREAAEVRYSNLISVDEKPFHYGTHYSSSMIVCHFLIRMAPYTNMFKTLQGGDWDLPDRSLSDISRAYESAARDIRGDVRELIPEFFHCPEFLENYANLDFGVQQNTGEKIHDVKLPPWARDDPLLFVIMNRKALESEFVSEHLPAWIDHLSAITDELEREATIGIIHNFGQTPRKLFTTPHPQRYNHGLPTLPIGTLHGIEEDFQLLIQGSRCFSGSSTPVKQLALDMIGERIIPCPEGVLVVPSHPHEQIEWGARTGGELRVVVDQKVIQVIEGTLCTCAAFADANYLVTGSSDHIVRLWSLTRGYLSGPSLALTVSHHMRVHTDRVVSVAASRPWSIAVSGSDDGSAAIWDLNRAVYVRSIWHDTTGDKSAAVHLIDINESTGYIATCSKLKLCLHTINARPIATLDLTTMPSSTLYPPITALSFHEREYSHLGVLATGSSDGTITLRTWTADGTPEGTKAKWEFITMRTMKVRTSIGRGGRTPAVTALKFLG